MLPHCVRYNHPSRRATWRGISEHIVHSVGQCPTSRSAGQFDLFSSLHPCRYHVGHREHGEGLQTGLWVQEERPVDLALYRRLGLLRGRDGIGSQFERSALVGGEEHIRVDLVSARRCKIGSILANILVVGSEGCRPPHRFGSSVRIVFRPRIRIDNLRRNLPWVRGGRASPTGSCQTTTSPHKTGVCE